MMRKVRIKEDVGTQDMRTFVILRVTSDYFQKHQVPVNVAHNLKLIRALIHRD